MEEKKKDGDPEIQEHGPEHWFSKWERQCLAEAEQRESNEEEADNDQDKLWHLFQNSATAVAQLYKGGAFFVGAVSKRCHSRNQPVQSHQRRNKDVLAWVKKRRRTIRREDLISFLCGRAPPPRSSRATLTPGHRLTMVSPNRPPPAPETDSSRHHQPRKSVTAAPVLGQHQCEISGKEAISALSRAKTRECRQQIAE
ncbi:unnamed protein product, partial [Coregonus sp. 'balchen']